MTFRINIPAALASLVILAAAPAAVASPISFDYDGICLDAPRDSSIACTNVDLDHGDAVSGRIEVSAFALDDFVLTGEEIRSHGAFDFTFGSLGFDDSDSFISGFLALDTSFNIIGGWFNINQFWNEANTLSFSDDGTGLWLVRAGLGRHARFAGGAGRYTTSLTVPEPGTLALLAIGLFGIGAARRRRTA